ncbi:GIY-YIG nuclease family protein [Lysobacter capsici]|uniref:GIY-YIG nuclease family protein n=1 Tax=Lysobacter capsici TaxID=435897 RepID=UPI0004512409|nr:GIY-YIG nuclease family protein [Lysobacter capsici]
MIRFGSPPSTEAVKPSNLNRTRLESLCHRIFQAVRQHLTIEDRFGNSVKPREWFHMPLHIIDEAVKRIQDGTITNVIYAPRELP